MWHVCLCRLWSCVCVCVYTDFLFSHARGCPVGLKQRQVWQMCKNWDLGWRLFCAFLRLFGHIYTLVCPRTSLLWRYWKEHFGTQQLLPIILNALCSIILYALYSVTCSASLNSAMFFWMYLCSRLLWKSWKGQAPWLSVISAHYI